MFVYPGPRRSGPRGWRLAPNIVGVVQDALTLPIITRRDEDSVHRGWYIVKATLIHIYISRGLVLSSEALDTAHTG